MKICLVEPSFPMQAARSRGGTETYLEILAKALLGKDHEVHVVVYGDGFPAAGKPILPVTLHVVALRGIRYLSAAFPGMIESFCLRDFVRDLDAREHFDIIEGCNDEGLQYATAAGLGNRYWMRLHSSLRQHIKNKGQPLNWRRRFAVWLDARAARRAPHLVTHSRHHAATMAAEYGVAPERIHVIPHALANTGHSRPAAALAEPPTFGYIGTLDQRKGIDVFLNAIPLILATQPAAKFIIIGRDGGDSSAQSWQRWFGQTHPQAQPQVAFTGPVSHESLETLWPTLSVSVVPSRYESFGFVVIEAFQRGVPVIVSDGGALPEVAGDAALIFRSGDAADLAQQARRLQEQPGLAATLAQRGQALFQQQYTLDRFAENVLSLYAKSGPPQPPPGRTNR